jgi:protein phosphatase 1 regulatory subunit 7
MVAKIEETKENASPVDGTIDENTEGRPGLSPRNSKGWDGKLRIDKKPVVLANPEAISDPEYSDDEHVLPGEQIDADEGSS